uniref:ER membrane protein complex subunit 4 n=1 Tax=Corethron hystrix TaxID=216773 RepID=A0A7S1FQ12_9STRA|mmetsp:Transcript_19516/g.44429  ORF Transcript_19516/g.44429 Transcript_19516/m.44429 type:complete len:213 (+) Transcript_19516:211-849(+)
MTASNSASTDGWFLDLNRRPPPTIPTKRQTSKRKDKVNSFSVVPSTTLCDVPFPPGCTSDAVVWDVRPKTSLLDGDGENKTVNLAMVNKKKKMAMNLALSPTKSIPMQFFMMWMSGRVLNIFSISITLMACLNPIKAILGISTAFQKFEDEDKKVDLTMPKLIFIGVNLVMLWGGMYKMGTLRLLPTTSADWSGYVVWKDVVELGLIPANFS